MLRFACCDESIDFWIVALLGSCTLFGGIIAAYFTLLSVNWFSFYFQGPPVAPLRQYRQNPARERCYALITGASAGIGYGVAHALLRRFFGGVILLGHDLDELRQAREELLQLFPLAHIKIVHHNAVTGNRDSLLKAMGTVLKLRITLLVNNVGGSPIEAPKIRTFESLCWNDIDDYLNLNARFMAQITNLLLPVLKSSGSPRSLIVNISSASTSGLPYVVMYTGTKAFNLSFTRSLYREFVATETPIDVLAILPGDVKSQGNVLGVPSGCIHSTEFAALLVDKIDLAVGRKMLQMSPLWSHDLARRLMEIIPEP